MKDRTHADSRQYWWIVPVVTFIFGVGGAFAVTQRDLSRHEKAIEALTKKTEESQVVAARIDQRLANIEQDIGEIKVMLQSKQ